MTPEELDKIENNQAAAMWIGGPTAAFAQDTLLLVKALREAWSALDQVSSDDRMSEAQIIATIRHAQAQKDEAIRQRDEAQAEVERLREVVRKVHGLVDGVTMIALPEAVHMLADIHKITKGMVE